MVGVCLVVDGFVSLLFLCGSLRLSLEELADGFGMESVVCGVCCGVARCGVLSC